MLCREVRKDMYMIAEDCIKTRKLLRLYNWHVGGGGYAMATGKLWHALFLNYDKGLVADHINKKKFDNRFDNLRVVTYTENSRNRTKHCNNTSGKQGVGLWTGSGCECWRAQIRVGNKFKAKRFSISKYGDDDAKRLAIEARKAMEVLYGFIIVV